MRQLVGGGWGLYKSAWRRLLLVAAVPALLQALLSLPGIAIALAAIGGMVRVFGDIARYRSDPVAFQTELQLQLRPPTDLLLLSALTAGISIAFTVIGWGAITAAALAASEGQPFSIASAFRVVLGRKRGIVIPALTLGIVWVAIAGLQAAVTPRNVAPAAGPNGSYALLGSLALLVTVIAFVMAVVWSLALPAILEEGLGLRRGLGRGAALTRGVRFRLGLAFIAVAIMQGVSVGIVSTAAAVAIGILARSIAVGVFVYFVALTIGLSLWLPFLPSILAVSYRDRTKPDDLTAQADGTLRDGDGPGIPEPS